MKNIKVYMILFLAVYSVNNAQLKIGDNVNVISPSSILELESNNKTLILPKVQNVTLITDPLPGMIVYEISSKCVRVYESSGWSSCLYTKKEITSNISYIIEGVKDRAYDEQSHRFIYTTFVGSDGRVWLKNNLGNNYSKVGHNLHNPRQNAQAVTDFNAYGSLFQFGRYADGHELINWTASTSGVPLYDTTTTQSNTPDHQKFIIGSSLLFDWRIDSYNNDPDGLDDKKLNNGSYGNCPEGYAIPSRSEWEKYILDSGVTSANLLLNSSLKLTLNGKRNYTNGNLSEVGVSGYYWTRTMQTNKTYYLKITNSNFEFLEGNRAEGFAIRCIKVL